MVRAPILTGLAAASIALGAGAIALFACGGEGFDPQSKVDSVRIFAVRADKPYAPAGETVNLEALIADGRRERPRPLRLYWIPFVCMNPPEDQYYRCFSPDLDAGGSGTRFIPAGPLADAGLPQGGDNPIAQIPTGVDLGPFLPQGTTFSFQMPLDAVVEREGAPPYGLAYVFNIACAGQVRLAARDPGGGPQQVPIQCTDESGTPLTPQDYVIGISRVYSYPDRTNDNPVVERVTLDGVDVDPDAGITVERCTAAKRADCREYKIDVKVPPSSWEENPSEAAPGVREQIWVTYYSDIGDFEDEARLLYSPRSGRIEDSDVGYRAPADPTDGTIWAVVHDNRAGSAFVVLPLHVR
jgi:hypothetical protein